MSPPKSQQEYQGQFLGFSPQIPSGAPSPGMGRRGSRGWGWAGGTGRAGGGKLSGLIAFEALTVSLFTRDPSRGAPRAQPSPAPLCSSRGEGWPGSRCSAPSLCSIPPLVLGGEALGFAQCSVRGRWVGAAASRGFQPKSQPQPLDVGNVPLHNPLYLSRARASLAGRSVPPSPLSLCPSGDSSTSPTLPGVFLIS